MALGLAESAGTLGVTLADIVKVARRLHLLPPDGQEKTERKWIEDVARRAGLKESMGPKTPSESIPLDRQKIVWLAPTRQSSRNNH